MVRTTANVKIKWSTVVDCSSETKRCTQLDHHLTSVSHHKLDRGDTNRPEKVSNSSSTNSNDVHQKIKHTKAQQRLTGHAWSLLGVTVCYSEPI